MTDRSKMPEKASLYCSACEAVTSHDVTIDSSAHDYECAAPIGYRWGAPHYFCGERRDGERS